RVTPYILLPCVTAAFPIKPRHRFHRTDFERLAEHVSSCLSGMTTIIAGVPQRVVPQGSQRLHSIDSTAILNSVLPLWGGATPSVSLAHLYRAFGTAFPRSDYR